MATQARHHQAQTTCLDTGSARMPPRRGDGVCQQTVLPIIRTRHCRKASTPPISQRQSRRRAGLVLPYSATHWLRPQRLPHFPICRYRSPAPQRPVHRWYLQPLALRSTFPRGYGAHSSPNHYCWCTTRRHPSCGRLRRSWCRPRLPPGGPCTRRRSLANCHSGCDTRSDYRFRSPRRRAFQQWVLWQDRTA